MDLKGFDFIKGKIVSRPWGIEYRFTASDQETKHEYNEIVMLKTGKETEKEIEIKIQNHLDKVSNIPEPEIDVNVLNDVTVKKYLVDNGYIDKDTELKNLKNRDQKWL